MDHKCSSHVRSTYTCIIYSISFSQFPNKLRTLIGFNYLKITFVTTIFIIICPMDRHWLGFYRLKLNEVHYFSIKMFTFKFHSTNMTFIPMSHLNSCIIWKIPFLVFIYIKFSVSWQTFQIFWNLDICASSTDGS